MDRIYDSVPVQDQRSCTMGVDIDAKRKGYLEYANVYAKEYKQLLKASSSAIDRQILALASMSIECYLKYAVLTFCRPSVWSVPIHGKDMMHRHSVRSLYNALRQEIPDFPLDPDQAAMFQSIYYSCRYPDQMELPAYAKPLPTTKDQAEILYHTLMAVKHTTIALEEQARAEQLRQQEEEEEEDYGR